MNRIHFSFLLGALALLPATADAQPKDSYKLKDVAWFVGQWRSPASEKLASEEHWSAPAAGAMVGMFRLTSAQKPIIYEFLLLEETADGVFMRLRHFKGEMVEVEKEPIRLKLIKASAGEAVFENPDNDKPKRITYRVDKADLLTVVVETVRNDKATAFTLKMQRVKK